MGRKELNNLTKLHKDSKTLFTGDHLWLDIINTFRNKLKDCVEKKAGKKGGFSRVFAIDGTDLSEFGFSKLKNIYPEATADVYSAELESVEKFHFSNPENDTSTVQLVGEFSIDPTQLPRWLAHRVEVAETGAIFGDTPAYTDNLKGQWYYKGTGGKHRDDKFKHIINNKPGIPKSSFLAARVLEKTQGGKVKFFRESDGKEFSIRIEKGEFLIMMAHAGLCNHKCEEGLYTIVTDFVLPYDAHREMKIHGGLKGKFEKFISDYATSISHL